MIHKICCLGMLALVGTVASAAWAEPETPRVDARQENQEQRIDAGVESGEVTKKEEKVLEHGQKKVEQAEEKAKADGVVTKREQKKLDRKQDRQSRRVYRAKHNAREKK